MGKGVLKALEFLSKLYSPEVLWICGLAVIFYHLLQLSSAASAFFFYKNSSCILSKVRFLSARDYRCIPLCPSLFCAWVLAVELWLSWCMASTLPSNWTHDSCCSDYVVWSSSYSTTLNSSEDSVLHISLARMLCRPHRNAISQPLFPEVCFVVGHGQDQSCSFKYILKIFVISVVQNSALSGSV